MQGVLITGGEQPEFNKISHYLRKSTYIVAADSGLDYCLKHSITPDYIIGDMDSVTSVEILKNFSNDIIERHPAEKDYTDTELGLMHFRKMNCSERIIIGGGGGRLDHLLAITKLFERSDPPDIWITDKEEVRFIDKVFHDSGNIGETISFFPVGIEVCTMTSTGLKWSLNNLIWNRGDCGISNELVKTEFTIIMNSGNLIMIRDIKEYHLNK